MKQLFVLVLLFILSCVSEETKSNNIYNKVKQKITSKSNIDLPQVVLDSLKSGDIILRRGDGPLSFHLSNTTKEAFTHCGIIVKEKEEFKVIHSIGGQVSNQEIDGVQLTTLKHFVDYASDSLLYICRPIFVDSANIKITNRAYYYLEKQVPFDHRFSMLSKDKMYCSELLYYIFKDINKEQNIFVIKKKHKAYLLLFSTFFNPTNFTKIYAVKPIAIY